MTHSAIELSFWIGFLGLLCPNYLIIIRIYDISLADIYRAPISASAAYDITLFMICAMVSMAPFFGGNVIFLTIKGGPRTVCVPLVY